MRKQHHQQMMADGEKDGSTLGSEEDQNQGTLK